MRNGDPCQASMAISTISAGCKGVEKFNQMYSMHPSWALTTTTILAPIGIQELMLKSPTTVNTANTPPMPPHTPPTTSALMFWTLKKSRSGSVSIEGGGGQPCFGGERRPIVRTDKHLCRFYRCQNKDVVCCCQSCEDAEDDVAGTAAAGDEALRLRCFRRRAREVTSRVALTMSFSSSVLHHGRPPLVTSENSVHRQSERGEATSTAIWRSPPGQRNASFSVRTCLCFLRHTSVLHQL